MTPQSQPFDEFLRPVFFHAHPDDETLATGALIAWLADIGRDVAVVTATRGERGEVRAEISAQINSDETLIELRTQELSNALAELGNITHTFLGWPPARAAGLEGRIYEDSGMVWVSDSVAGSSPDARETALSKASKPEAVADLVAFLSAFRADALITYDIFGGYFHPDHVASHRIGKAAAAQARLPFIEIVSTAHLPPTEYPAEAFTFELPQFRPQVTRALSCYQSQLTVDGDKIIHVGGQSQDLLLAVTLNLPRKRKN